MYIYSIVSAFFKKRRQQITCNASTPKEVQKSYYTWFQNTCGGSH